MTLPGAYVGVLLGGAGPATTLAWSRSGLRNVV
ncbi:hypothetical protein RAM_33300 [Amycolatopsis mediterranei S699]|uniref:Uncharacterized protein n=1 Tax=Amycolatopsis mediterranei (strain S699) TaxID=713604 RepID=A0A9R0UBV5_AMYMS|nr:hypothetical protein RAM_33300 [Amycolatopsis mediterranei S699]